jgi:integrase
MNRHRTSASAARTASKSLPNVIPLPSAARAASRPTNSFTKSGVKRMRCPQEKKEAFFWDPSCPGFGLRALKSGRRSWVYQYRDGHSRTRRIALGDVSKVDLEAARKVARRHAASVAQGANPSVDRKAQRNALTVLDVVELYLAHAQTRQRPRSYRETERHLRSHAAPLHHERVEAIRRRDISALLERIAKDSGPIAANRLRAALSALWTWGLRSGRIEGDTNPVSFTVRQEEKQRERVLNNAELQAIWEATAGGGDYARIVRLCLLTGCRREEIGGLRWDEVHDDRLVIATDRMKGNSAHEVPVLPLIASTLPERPEGAEGCVFGRYGTGFSGWSKSKQVLDEKLAKAGVKLPPWSLHDLRRTFSTRLHDAAVEPIVVEALLAHKQQGVAAVYNRASLREAKKSALARWHAILRDIIGPEPEMRPIAMPVF